MITLVLPLIFCLIGALAALFYRFPIINRRLSVRGLGWLLAIAPLAAFFTFLGFLPAIKTSPALEFQVAWMPSFGLHASLYFDGLSALFALLISGIGALVLVYTGYYFANDQGAWRFFTYILLFMSAMLGVVLAGDLVTIFVFWEATSVISFLLVAYKYKDAAARRGAFKALLITGGGGVALLAGFVLAGITAGSFQLSALLSSGEALRQSALYPAILLLIALGAFTKSAQSPFHIWLPNAMSAPTPASAFLHSATMVKAGIYLLARLNPALGNTDLWFYLMSLTGMVTMLVGAYLGMKQNDLKALLAYSTITQLGVLVVLIGQDTEIAYKALVIGVLAHALYKSALFLSVGIIDHETGTRDLRQLGGLRWRMPITFAITSLAGLSMAGLPPMFGFLAKETLLATVTHPDVPLVLDRIFTIVAVAAGALLLAQSTMLVADTFLGRPRSTIQAHEAPLGMLLAPAAPTLLSLFISGLPETRPVAELLAGAANAAYGAPVKVSLALWTGVSIPLVLSAVAILLGSVLFAFRQPFRAWQAAQGDGLDLNRVYSRLLQLLDRAAYQVTRTQNGILRYYLSFMLAGMGLLLIFYGDLPFDIFRLESWNLGLGNRLGLLRLFALLLSVAAAGITIFMRRDLFAILALGASGLSVAILMVLEPAPDVALVQIVVDLLMVIILILALTRLPRQQRERAGELTFLQKRPGLARDALLATGAGVVMTVIVFSALTSRPRNSQVTPYYAGNALSQAGASDIVSAIVVDFRGLDTLVEIFVFAMAGMGIYTLLRYASRKAGDRDEQSPLPSGRQLPTRGIGGSLPSVFIQALANLALPVSWMIAIAYVMYGHLHPGDGFTAGVIVGLGIGLWYVVFGYDATHRRLPWIRPLPLAGAGLFLAVLNGLASLAFGGSILSPVNYGALLGLPLPAGFKFSTAFVFEVAIFLAVLGGVLAMLDALGHPKDDDPESSAQLQEIREN